MGLLPVLAFVFGMAAYSSLVGKANSWEGYECFPHTKTRNFPALAVPWPLRRRAYSVRPKEGDINKCIGEFWNGRWWHK